MITKREFTKIINQQLKQTSYIIGNFDIEIDKENKNGKKILQLLYRVTLTPTTGPGHHGIIIYGKVMPTTNHQILENTHHTAGQNRDYVRGFNKSAHHNREKIIKTTKDRGVIEEICKFIQ